MEDPRPAFPLADVALSFPYHIPTRLEIAPTVEGAPTFPGCLHLPRVPPSTVASRWPRDLEQSSLLMRFTSVGREDGDIVSLRKCKVFLQLMDPG